MRQKGLSIMLNCRILTLKCLCLFIQNHYKDVWHKPRECDLSFEMFSSQLCSKDANYATHTLARHAQFLEDITKIKSYGLNKFPNIIIHDNVLE